MLTILLTVALAAPVPSPTIEVDWVPGDYAVQVIGGDLGKGEIVGVIDAPMDSVLAVILDCEGTSAWFPQIRDTRAAAGELCSGRTDLPWPMADRVWNIEVGHYTETVDNAQVEVVPFLYVGGGNLAEMYGGYHLSSWGPNGEQTLVSYEAWVDLGTWIPDVLVQWATRRILPGVLTGLETEARRRGPIKPV